MTANETALQCLDWNNPQLALRSGDLQSIEFIFIECYSLASSLYRIEWHTPEWYDFTEKECGPIPEGADENDYYDYRYYEYVDWNQDWEAAIYLSDETFDPENYNEKSIKRESKLAF